MNAMQYECYPEEFKTQVELGIKDKKVAQQFLKNLPDFKTKYQRWYSEALSVVKVVLADRLDDFIKLYEKPKTRKSVDYGSYVVSDYLQSLRVTFGGEVKVDKSAAIPQFTQQLRILESLKSRFHSSLFDIKQLLQADLFDTELDAANELLKKGFLRAAGAMAGVVLEKHLAEVCSSHNIKLTNKNLHISELNDALKDASVIDGPTWRFIQHLADLRNLCDHNKKKEPKDIEVDDLIKGTQKISKTIF